jgi:ubiquinone/menaquinone biosynthesis C-methylase UbiE
MKDQQLRTGSHEVFRDIWKTSPHYYVHSLAEAMRYSQVSDLFKFEWLEKIFPDGEGIRSLEVGCGAAGASAYFTGRGYSATVIDLTETALLKARESFQRYNLSGGAVLGNALQLPFKDGSFDVVMSFGLLEHFEAPEQPIREMVRVLKPGGLFFGEIVTKKISVQTPANFLINGLAAFVYWTLHGSPGYGFRKGLRKMVSIEDFYESTYPARRFEKAAGDCNVVQIRCTGANPIPDLYLPPFLMPTWVKWLKGRRHLWQRFNNSESHFAKRYICRGWFLWGRKTPLREDSSTL